MSQQRHHDDGVEEAPQLPLGTKDYVACRKCHSILTQPQFNRDGCRKCELDGEVTNKFTGFVGLIAPELSWVARMIGCGHMPSGIYAATLEDEDDEADDAVNGMGAPFDEQLVDEDAYDDADDEPVKKSGSTADDASKKRSRDLDEDEIDVEDILAMGE